MADQATINEVCTHLRLMGYDVSVDDDEIKTIGARHRERLNMRVKVFDAGIFLSALCGAGESAKRVRRFVACRDSNRRGVFGQHVFVVSWKDSITVVKQRDRSFLIFSRDGLDKRPYMSESGVR